MFVRIERKHFNIFFSLKVYLYIHYLAMIITLNNFSLYNHNDNTKYKVREKNVTDIKSLWL